MCAKFQLKRTTLTFLAQICPKRKLGFEIQKTDVEIRVSMLEIPCLPIFRQNEHLWLFGLKFAQKCVLGQNFKNLSLDSESASLRYCVRQFSDKTDNFWAKIWGNCPITCNILVEILLRVLQRARLRCMEVCARFSNTQNKRGQ